MLRHSYRWPGLLLCTFFTHPIKAQRATIEPVWSLRGINKACTVLSILWDSVGSVQKISQKPHYFVHTMIAINLLQHKKIVLNISNTICVVDMAVFVNPVTCITTLLQALASSDLMLLEPVMAAEVSTHTSSIQYAICSKHFIHPIVITTL